MAHTLITDRQSAHATYRIIKRLGKGGMAEVFLAKQQGMAGFKRLAVLKRILPTLSSTESIVQMLLDEARIAGQLNHPNIVQVYDIGQEDGQYFIAMEYVDGCDLATLARIERHRQSRIPMRLALRVVSEAAMGLDYAHRYTGIEGEQLNIVHRDISPHNIMCSREGSVKLTDFGIAKAVGRVQVTEAGVIKGKVHYMAPEQYTGSPVDKRADVYSLGVVLYQLTVGKLPRVAADGQVVMKRVIEGDIPRPTELRSNYPKELEGIVMRALAHEPKDRYQEAASFRDDLIEFARAHDLLAFPKELGDYVEQLVPAEPTYSSHGALDTPVLTGPPRRPQVTGPSQPASDRTIRDDVPPEGMQPSAVINTANASDPSEDTVVSLRPVHPVDTQPDIVQEDVEIVSSEYVDGGQASMAKPPNDGAPEARGTEAIARGPRKKPADTATAAGSLPGSSGPERKPLAAEPAPKDPAKGAMATVDGKSRATRPSTHGKTDPVRQSGARPASPLPWIILAIIGVGVVGFGAYYFSSRPDPNVVTPPTPPPKTGPPQAGAVDVQSQPAKATVSIDGAQRCDTTPCRVPGLPLGRELLITVRASDGKHSIWMQRVVLTEAEPRLFLKASLAPLGSPKIVDASVADTAVAADAAPKPDLATAAGKKPTGKKPAGKKPTGKKPTGKKPTGKKPTGKKPTGKKPAGKKPKKGGPQVTIRPHTKPDQAIIAIDVRPIWAEIWVGGQKVGVTPMQRVIPPGTYKVELKNPEAKYYSTVTVKVENGKKVRIIDRVTPPE